MLIAWWNIEKNGQSSILEKQTKVSDFIDRCCASDKGLGVDLLFLCEVHSARFEDYRRYLEATYTSYAIHVFAGGNSNYYVVLMKVSPTLSFIESHVLKGLNRSLVVYAQGGCYIGFGHFKSGQLSLTKSQLRDAAILLEGKSTSNWALCGDLNWDYSKRTLLTLPDGTRSFTLWTDATQKSGNILDWVLNGKNTAIAGFDLTGWPATYQEMTAPDHKPVIFYTGVQRDESKAV